VSEENSLLFWYPKIKNLGIPTPRTEIVKLKGPVCEEDLSNLVVQWDEISEKAGKIGYPLFMRTDEFSGKHEWGRTCFVESERNLKPNIAHLIESSFGADIIGLPIRALVFREYIPMKNLFKAFYGEMPVNPEIRFFVENEKALCWHWYWVMDAIKRGTPKGILPKNWKKILQKEQESISSDEISMLENYAGRVSNAVKGYWSVDFCKAKDSRWILIDMANGERSWHPEDCKIYKR